MEELQEESYIKHRTYERCQEFYIQARAVLLEQQESADVSNLGSRRSESAIPEARHTFRGCLPKISLPSFAGDYHSWRSFHDLFTSLVIGNGNLTNVERMHYLKTCLTGDAAKLVTNLRVTDNTFSIAWKTLVTRYENKRVLISAQLDKLFGLKPIKSRSAKELNTMIATVSAALGALEALDCNISAWDPFLVYHLAHLLDENTREEWEVKLGPSMSYPTFKEFEDFLIGYTRAWESLTPAPVKSNKEKNRSSWPQNKPEAKSHGLVASASSKGEMKCRLCKSTHYLSNCHKYLSLPVERRRRTIFKLNLCYNCLGSHRADACPSSHTCKKCHKKHHTTIHDDYKFSEKSAAKTVSDSSNDTKSSLASPSISK
ncbi:hypothetical protein ALC62_00087 [Cyphomyrmex costatus]|uniref:Peptidase aspartic putative domain-containing protein n=1 Tax=Cyphomyrmex costatus TaxID=456900 RepID=A0A151K1R7_9HYME|nr:hypothetical protein ALC62_00087 [Cyphomyrmex costatus]